MFGIRVTRSTPRRVEVVVRTGLATVLLTILGIAGAVVLFGIGDDAIVGGAASTALAVVAGSQAMRRFRIVADRDTGRLTVDRLAPRGGRTVNLDLKDVIGVQPVRTSPLARYGPVCAMQALLVDGTSWNLVSARDAGTRRAWDTAAASLHAIARSAHRPTR